MYHHNNESTVSPKKMRSWPLYFGLQQHSIGNCFLGHHICSKHLCTIQIFSSITTLHWADSLYSLEKKLALLSQVATTAARRHAWPATQDPNSQFTRSSLQSAFIFRIESLKDKNILPAWPRFKRWPERPGLPRVLTGGPAPLSATFSTFSNINKDLKRQEDHLFSTGNMYLLHKKEVVNIQILLAAHLDRLDLFAKCKPVPSVLERSAK